jgi:hypothetical protein
VSHLGGAVAFTAPSGSVAPLVVAGCTFAGNATNTQQGQGGALWTTGAAIVRDCTFIGNSARVGGALTARGARFVVVARCAFYDNRALIMGGAIDNAIDAWPPGNGQGLLVTNCLLAGNEASDGGAISSRYFFGPDTNSLWLVSSTLVRNRATSLGGGGLYLNENTVVTVANSLFRDNTGPSGAQIYGLDGSTHVNVLHSNVQGGLAGVASGGNVSWGAGNLDADPLFADPDGPDGDPATHLDNDYRLSALSPCIDAGENAWVLPDAADTDLDGDVTEPEPLDYYGMPRQVDVPSVPDTGSGAPPLVDIGAHEALP